MMRNVDHTRSPAWTPRDARAAATMSSYRSPSGLVIDEPVEVFSRVVLISRRRCRTLTTSPPPKFFADNNRQAKRRMKDALQRFFKTVVSESRKDGICTVSAKQRNSCGARKYLDTTRISSFRRRGTSSVRAVHHEVLVR